MYFSKTVALALITALPAVLGRELSGPKSRFRVHIDCMDLNGAPSTEDVTAVINQLGPGSENTARWVQPEGAGRSKTFDVP